MFWTRARNNTQCFGQEYVDFAIISNVLAVDFATTSNVLDKNMWISQQPAMFWERFGHDLGMFWA